MNLKNVAKSLTLGLLSTGLLAVGGCSHAKNDATQAVSAAESALAAVQDGAARYMPKELESVESSVTALKGSLAQGDYKTVVANAPAVNSSLESLKAGVAAKMEENKAAAAEWGSYATAVPQMVTALQSRVDTITRSKHMPKGLDSQAFGTVKTDLESMKTGWAAASAAHDSGNDLDAVARARSVKAAGEKLMVQLGMTKG